jgi:hypothetical protein
MDDVRLSWQSAYAQRGAGSTFARARIIASDVYDRGAPIPTVSASPDQKPVPEGHRGDRRRRREGTRRPARIDRRLFSDRA